MLYIIYVVYTGGINLGYRKLIKFGNSSHIISLPSSWVKKNKLKKGDLIYFTENGSNELILTSKEDNKEIPEKEITIDITEKNFNQIRREISTAYVNNYRVLNIIGKNLSGKLQDVKKCLNNLMSMEIMEQTSKNIIAKDFLDINTISIENIIRKIDIIIRSLIADSKLTLNENNSENIYQRDEDVNRLCFLILRTIKFNLTNLSNIKEPNITPIILVGYWRVTDYLEKIADEIKRIARFVTKAKLKNKKASEFLNLYSKIEAFYLETMKTYYNKNKEDAIKLTDRKKEFIVLCDRYLEKYGNSKWTPNLIERLKIMINEIYSIARTVYEMYD